MANRFKIIRGNKENNDDNEIITCNGLGLTRKQERDIMSKSKYKVGQAIYLAEEDGTILEQGEIEEVFYDKLQDGNFTYVYNMVLTDEDSESYISDVYETTMSEEGFYSKEEYIQKYNKEPVYIPQTYDDMEGEQLEMFD